MYSSVSSLCSLNAVSYQHLDKVDAGVCLARNYFLHLLSGRLTLLKSPAACLPDKGRSWHSPLILLHILSFLLSLVYKYLPTHIEWGDNPKPKNKQQKVPQKLLLLYTYLNSVGLSPNLLCYRMGHHLKEKNTLQSAASWHIAL